MTAVEREEMAEQLADRTRTLYRFDFFRADHACNMQEAIRARLADTDDQQRSGIGQFKDIADAELIQQDFLVGDGIREEWHGQEIAFRSGLFGKALDHVEWIGGETPRQSA